MSARQGSTLRDAWDLARPYWRSEERWVAWGLLAAIVILNLGTVLLSVRLNIWRGAFYNALQEYDWPQFWTQLALFCLLAAVYIISTVYQTYLLQMLQIRWRRWLTDRYLAEWLSHRTYYRLQAEGSGTDNPDQRISEDLNLFADRTLFLGLGLLNAVATLLGFMFQLWALSGDFTIPLGSWGQLTIPGFMLWAALVYAIVGTWLTRKIGQPLVGLNYTQQRYEADFRYSLVRLRENAETVAFYGGEQRELATFKDRFANVLANFWSIMRRQKKLNWLVQGYGQAAVVFPFLVSAPRYFNKEIQLGGLMQIAEAFGQVQVSLSWIVNSYSDIANWQSVVRRLTDFRRRVDDIRAEEEGPSPIAIERETGGLAVKHLDLDLPGGVRLRNDVNLAAAPGDSLLVTGPSGVGKSTLLRAIAGLWRHGRGAVRLPKGRALFLPQRPYMPLGTLRQALAYPDLGDELPRERLVEALASAGLPELEDELDTVDNWGQRLSLGEQQRLAFARVMLAEPEIVFLDEATSALDEPTERELYEMLRKAPWRPTVVSVGHRSTLREFHDREVPLGAPKAAAA